MKNTDASGLESQVSEALMHWSAISLVVLAVVIVYSIRNGGIKEAFENIFLWFLITFAFWNLFVLPVDTDDEISAGILFVAFGVCRIAKNLSKKT